MRKKPKKKGQVRPMQIPDGYNLPDEVVLDVYYDATERYEVGEVKSKDAQSDKEDTLAMIDRLVDSVREEAFCKGYRLGHFHCMNGLPVVPKTDDRCTEQEGWV